MPYFTEAQTIFTQDGTKASYIACPAGQSVTVFSNGATLYYDDASTVTSASNDGNIATAASSTFTGPQWVICAQGASTQVFVRANETSTTRDVEVDGALNHDGSTVGFYGTTPVAKHAALTAADGGTVDTTYGQDEADVITNLVTRQAEIEDVLVDLGLLTAAS